MDDEEYAQEVERGAWDFEALQRRMREELPTEDGTYTFDGERWTTGELVELSAGYWVAQTQGDQDPAKLPSGTFLGIWTDPETGKVHLDATLWIYDLDVAITYGRSFRQLAIWDIANGKEIRL